MRFQSIAKRTDCEQFTREFKVYQCEDCSGCPLRSPCTTAQEGTNRKMLVNTRWEKQKVYVRHKLSEPETAAIYRQHKVDVEPVFGFLKAMNFRKYRLRAVNE